MKYLTIRLDAPHDANGNPRRVFVTIDTTNGQRMVATYDDGYAGFRAITNKYHRAGWNGLSFVTTPKEYRELVKFGAES